MGAKGKELTTYLHPTYSIDFQEVFVGNARAINQARPEQKFVYEPETSQACTLAGLLMAAANTKEDELGGAGIVPEGSAGADPDAPYAYQAAVFKNANIFTALTLHEVDGQFLKLRYSEGMSDTSDKDRANQICAMLAGVTIERHNELLKPL